MSWSPWEFVARCRAAAYDRGLLPRHRLPAPTIAIGALEMGGTGKTPATAALAALLLQRGHRVAILSRGYGRRDRRVRIVSLGEGPLVPAAQSGDEPAWYARVVPGVAVAVSARREAAAKALSGHFDTEIFLLDDAFQHLRVHRDVNLLVVDGDAPFWQGSPPPRGRLREGVAAAARADAFLVIGAGARECERWLGHRFPGRPVFGMTREYPGAVAAGSWLQGAPAPAPIRPVLAFSGIARPQRFFEAIRRAQWPVIGERTFRDHYWYRPDDLAGLRRAARDAGATTLMTTEKDAVRLADAEMDVSDLLVWPMRLSLQAADATSDWLWRRLVTVGAP